MLPGGPLGFKATLTADYLTVKQWDRMNRTHLDSYKDLVCAPGTPHFKLCGVKAAIHPKSGTELGTIYPACIRIIMRAR